ncbi:hypothetical protein OGAPHI_001991 [Ogataea philodendri]|uniref:Uncharacterized protein n=1 Tax=Ogataea philodendri TaxID=1378263 RepID=A0A9P8PA54_9ASCO|nr:uncharacterized protein OGAPHI_001991 [Ogataea philodendri]KAH3668237.1 hypothetical protein OGAPHI_001991 [Ogataea philodendri]
MFHVVFGVQGLQCLEQRVFVCDLQVEQELELELVRRDHVDQAGVNDLAIHRYHVLAHVDLAVVAHDRVEQPETVWVGFLDVCAHFPDRGQGVGAVDVPGEHSVVLDADLLESSVHLGQFLARNNLAVELAVPGVVGEIDGVEHVNVPPEHLQRERRGLVAHVPVDNVRLYR